MVARVVLNPKRRKEYSLARIMIKLRGDIVFEDPQSRIREYCEIEIQIEIHHGYDDKHNINNLISEDNIRAANELYAMINVYDKNESERLLSCSQSISALLSAVPNIDLYAVSDKDWPKLRSNIKALFTKFLSIKGFGLAKATKILHLKRPNLFPILDSFIIKFILDCNISDLRKSSQIEIGLQALEHARELIGKQKVEFEKLVEQTKDLPIPLTPVRMFDILCWTAEKWDIRRILNAPYGVPSGSLLASFKSRRGTTSDIEKMESDDKYVVFEDLERATGPKVHNVNCFYYKRWLNNPTTTTTWQGPYESEEKAWQICKKLSLRSGFEPSKHRCVRQC